MISTFVDGILGIPPEGYEWLSYVISAVVLIFVLRSINMFFGAIVNLFSIYK